MNKFSNIISSLRLSRDLSQEQLAKILEVSKSSVGMWETGKRLPSPELYERIADYFNVDMDYLYGRTDTPRRIIFDEFGNEYINSNKSEVITTDISPALDMATLSQLTEPNIQKVNTYSRSLLELQNIELPVLNAAHALSEASKEDSKHDDQIMDDEDF